MDNMSVADIAAVTRNNGYGYGDGCGYGMGGWWMIILFALIFNGNGFWGNRGNCCNGEPVTESALCNSMNFNNLENAVGRINDNQAAIARQTDNAICQLGYQAAQLSNQTQRDLCTGFTNIASQLADCCCTIQRGIDQVNYNGAMNTAAINANTTAGVQKILDKMSRTRQTHCGRAFSSLSCSPLCAALSAIPQVPHLPRPVIRFSADLASTTAVAVAMAISEQNHRIRPYWPGCGRGNSPAFL